MTQYKATFFSLILERNIRGVELLLARTIVRTMMIRVSRSRLQCRKTEEDDKKMRSYRPRLPDFRSKRDASFRRIKTKGSSKMQAKVSAFLDGVAD